MATPATEIDPLFDPAVMQDPYDYYRYLRENDPVHEIPGTGAYLVTRAQTIFDVVGNTAVFSSVSGEFPPQGGVGEARTPWLERRGIRRR